MHDRRDDPTFENAEEGRKYTADRRSIVRTAFTKEEESSLQRTIHDHICNKIDVVSVTSEEERTATTRRVNKTIKNEKKILT